MGCPQPSRVFPPRSSQIRHMKCYGTSKVPHINIYQRHEILHQHTIKSTRKLPNTDKKHTHTHQHDIRILKKNIANKNICPFAVNTLPIDWGDPIIPPCPWVTGGAWSKRSDTVLLRPIVRKAQGHGVAELMMPFWMFPKIVVPPNHAF